MDYQKMWSRLYAEALRHETVAQYQVKNAIPGTGDGEYAKGKQEAYKRLRNYMIFLEKMNEN